MRIYQAALHATKLSSLCCAILIAGEISAAPPSTINYQGFALDSQASPLDGVFDVTFSLWGDLTGPSQLWTEIQMVSFDNGTFSVELGTILPLSPTIFSQPVFLSVKIGTDPELSPRKPLSTVPYAFRVTQPFDKIIVVSGAGSELDNGTNLLNAASTIPGGLTDPYVVLLEPGVFDLADQSLILREGTSLIGSGRLVSVVRSTAGITVSQGGMSEIRDLTIENASPSNAGAALFLGNALDVVVSRIRAIGTGAAVGNGVVSGIRMINSSGTFEDVEATADGGGFAEAFSASGNILVAPEDSTLNLKNVTAIGRNAPSIVQGINIKGHVIDGSDVQAEAIAGAQTSFAQAINISDSTGTIRNFEAIATGLSSSFSAGLILNTRRDFTLIEGHVLSSDSTLLSNGIRIGATQTEGPLGRVIVRDLRAEAIAPSATETSEVSGISVVGPNFVEFDSIHSSATAPTSPVGIDPALSLSVAHVAAQLVVRYSTFTNKVFSFNGVVHMRYSDVGVVGIQFPFGVVTCTAVSQVTVTGTAFLPADCFP